MSKKEPTQMICPNQQEISQFEQGLDELAKTAQKRYQDGIKAGMKKMAEWANEICKEEEHFDWWSPRKRLKCPDCWQAKLKEIELK